MKDEGGKLTLHPFAFILHSCFCGSSSVGRASAFQAEGREFEPRLPLQKITVVITKQSLRASGDARVAQG